MSIVRANQIDWDLQAASQIVREKLGLQYVVLHHDFDVLDLQDRFAATQFGQVLTRANSLDQLLDQLRVIALITPRD